jgi:hypothetical protein
MLQLREIGLGVRALKSPFLVWHDLQFAPPGAPSTKLKQICRIRVRWPWSLNAQGTGLSPDLRLLFGLDFGKPLPAPADLPPAAVWARSSVGRASDF